MDYMLFISGFFFLAFSLCFSPGPNNTMCMAMAMAHGFRAPMLYSLGSVLGALVTFILTALGLGEIFLRYPHLYLTLRVIGGAYLLWLALSIAGINPLSRLLHLSGKSPKKAGAGGPAKPLNFRQGLTLQMVNIKVWMGHVIAIGTYAGADEYMWRRMAIIAAMFSLFGWLANMVWALGGAAMNRFLSTEGIRRVNYVFAASLALSVVLIFFQ